jgi:hypothetical protein
MITIGVEKDEVLARMNEQKHKSVDIIGLVVSQAHDSYVMLVKAAGSEQIEGAFFLCDRVAKSLQRNAAGELIMVSAQELKSIDQPRNTETTSGGTSLADFNFAQWAEQNPIEAAAQVAEYTKKRSAAQQLTPR